MSGAATAAARRIFVTGAEGLVGRALVTTLVAHGYAVRGLSRSATAAADPGPWVENEAARVVAGELAAPRVWSAALDGCDAVVHLAARTGKAAPAEYEADNVDGTRRLLEACRQAGVPRFLFVSSVAARFPRKPDYPYARSKAAAEELVRAAGVRFAIVRPTIVVGPGSGSLAGLARLAALPLVPLFGGGRAPVQPIWVGDLAFQLRRILERDRFGGETLELGGPEALPIGDLLRQIGGLEGRSDRTVSVPSAPVLALLAIGEKVARPLLPVTRGQLASFVHDGSVAKNPLFEPGDELLTVDQMLRAAGVGRGAGGD